MSTDGVGNLSGPPWCVLSMLFNTIHVKTMSLITFDLCSIVLSKILNLVARIPNAFSTTLLSLDPRVSTTLLSCSLHSLSACELCCRVSQHMASRQRCHHPARYSANLVLPHPRVQVVEVQRCRSRSFSLTCCG